MSSIEDMLKSADPMSTPVMALAGGGGGGTSASSAIRRVPPPLPPPPQPQQPAQVYAAGGDDMNAMGASYVVESALPPPPPLQQHAPPQAVRPSAMKKRPGGGTGLGGVGGRGGGGIDLPQMLRSDASFQQAIVVFASAFCLLLPNVQMQLRKLAPSLTQNLTVLTLVNALLIAVAFFYSHNIVIEQLLKFV